jgi:dihydrodipicolinate synthase/N-acetylneuraminate lyase
MIERLKCVTPALVTPLKKNGTFDEAGMKNLVKYLVNRGMNTLFILGYSGECRAFNRAERRRITEVTREAAGKDVLIISGAMGDSTQIIQEFSDDAADAGADMTLLTPTDFFFLTDDELKSLFVRLADNAKIPFMIYNCPENHHYVNAEMMAELAKHPNILALKQSTGVDKIQTMLQTINPKENFILLSGDEFVYYPAMTLGVQGFIMGGPGNIMPEKCNEILDNYRKGNNDAAREEYMKLISFFRELYTTLPYPMVISQIKAVMEIVGVCERWMRHPVREVSNEHMRVIEDMLKRHNVKV